MPTQTRTQNRTPFRPRFRVRRPDRHINQTTALVVYGLAAALYLTVGIVLSAQGIFFGDALSRLQTAESVFFSDRPALANIGFVFTPLTTLAELPLTVLSPLLPALTASALAATAVSALFMAGAVRQVWLVGKDGGVSTVFLVTVTVLFATNPMIVLYGANGMSEAPFLFTCAWATRRMMRFARTDDVHDLMASGLGLSLAFLARYEALAAAGAGALVVAGLALMRGREQGRRMQWERAVTDAVVFLFPVILASTVWFFTSWLTTGTAVAQFSGTYGNAAIIESTGGGAAGGTVGALTRILLLAPGLPILVVAAVVLARRRHSPGLFPPLVVLGSVLGFQVFTAAAGATFGLLRFFIVAILLATILSLLVPLTVGELRSSRPGRFPWDGGTALPLYRPRVTTAATLVLLLVGTVSTTVTMTDRRWAPQEYALAAATPLASRLDGADLDERRAVLRTYRTERRLAEFLDASDLAAGSVLLDTTFGFPVPLFSERPSTFVIPSDPDFVTSLDDPYTHGVRYILAVPPDGRGAQDAVNLRYPTFYDNGSGVATLDIEIANDGAGQPDFRLYRVRETPVG